MQIISFVIKLSFGLVLCSINNFPYFKLLENNYKGSSFEITAFERNFGSAEKKGWATV